MVATCMQMAEAPAKCLNKRDQLAAPKSTGKAEYCIVAATFFMPGGAVLA